MKWSDIFRRKNDQGLTKSEKDQPSFFQIARAMNSDEARRLAKAGDLEGLADHLGLEGETVNYDEEKAKLDRQYEAGLLTKKEYKWKCRSLWADFHW